MDKDHVDLFIAVLMSKVNESIVKNNIDTDSKPTDEHHDKIWASIDIEQVYEVTGALNDQLNQLKIQADDLLKRGNETAGNEMNNLYGELTREKRSFLKGEINAADYAKKSSDLLEKASKGELKEHRGILIILLSIVKFFTLGFVKEITPTKSIQKISNLKGSLKHIKDEANPLDENRNQNTANCGLSQG